MVLLYLQYKYYFRSFFHYVALAFFCCLALSPCELLAQTSSPPTLPPEIRKALERNAQMLSPVTVQWRLQRHSNRTIDELVKDLGSKRYGFYQPVTGTFILEGSMFYKSETLNQSVLNGKKNEFVESTYSSSFDGEIFFHINKKPFENYSVVVRDRWEGKYGQQAPEVVERFGFYLPMGASAQHAILYNLEQGGRLVSASETAIKGTPSIVVQLIPKQWSYPYWRDRQYKYYLDPQKGYGVCQIDWVLPNGRLLCRTKNSDWEKLSKPDTWLPKRSSCEWYTWHSCPDQSFEKVLFSEDFTTDILRESWPLSKFSRDLNEPGVVIDDPRPGAKSKPGATWNNDVEAWTYTNPKDLPDLPSRKPYRLILIVVSLVLISIIVFIKIRRAKQT